MVRASMVFLLGLSVGGCANRSVNGSNKARECPGKFFVIAENRTGRTYDIMYDEEKIGTVGPRATQRISVPAPANGRAHLKESETTSLPSTSSGRGRPAALRIVCEA